MMENSDRHKREDVPIISQVMIPRNHQYVPKNKKQSKKHKNTKTIIDVAMCGNNCCCLTDDNEIWYWGLNTFIPQRLEEVTGSKCDASKHIRDLFAGPNNIYVSIHERDDDTKEKEENARLGKIQAGAYHGQRPPFEISDVCKQKRKQLLIDSDFSIHVSPDKYVYSLHSP
jgi:alpha-tubulin suppressor-like RCC1 family protein